MDYTQYVASGKLIRLCDNTLLVYGDSSLRDYLIINYYYVSLNLNIHVFINNNIVASEYKHRKLCTSVSHNILQLSLASNLTSTTITIAILICL